MLQKVLLEKKYNAVNVNIEALDSHFDTVCIFDSNNSSNVSQANNYSKLIAIGAVRELMLNSKKDSLKQLQAFIDFKKSWSFGFLSYDLKNEIENLKSENDDGLNFPLLHFFEPKFIVEIFKEKIEINFDDSIVNNIELDNLKTILFSDKKKNDSLNSSIQLNEKINKSGYIDAVNGLKKHIALGDIYEVNFCKEFFSSDAGIFPIAVYERLNNISAAPFASFCKFKNHYLLSSSPERFIQKNDKKLISQPIKGTAKRSIDKEEDDNIKNVLKNNLKEQTENVMIVDLVRNDLSKLAKKGSVCVDELFGVHSFKQVHQMISTISCELKNDLKFTEIIAATFPMGSMTGAPKVSAMKLIEQFEKTKRGLYSGSVGYIKPNGDFDFNVVIRSILYNKENKYLSFMVGSAITSNADAEQEYEECMLKAKAMFEVLK